MKKKEKKQLIRFLIGLVILAILSITAYFNPDVKEQVNSLFEEEKQVTTTVTSFDLSSIPEYKDSPYVYINDNKPNFTEEDYTTEAFEKYSELDSLGRCGVAFANICTELMPTEDDERTSISNIEPSGWENVKYDGIVDGGYLYNRSHLIGWQLAGENANEKNLITGTRYMNVEGMLPFENMVDDYFEKDNLVASGVQMEAYSVEDNGEGVCFNVYVYNVQPGIEIDYKTGKSLQSKTK